MLHIYIYIQYCSVNNVYIYIHHHFHINLQYVSKYIEPHPPFSLTFEEVFFRFFTCTRRCIALKTSVTQRSSKVGDFSSSVRSDLFFCVFFCVGGVTFVPKKHGDYEEKHLNIDIVGQEG